MPRSPYSLPRCSGPAPAAPQRKRPLERQHLQRGCPGRGTATGPRTDRGGSGTAAHQRLLPPPKSNGGSRGDTRPKAAEGAASAPRPCAGLRSGSDSHHSLPTRQSHLPATAARRGPGPARPHREGPLLLAPPLGKARAAPQVTGRRGARSGEAERMRNGHPRGPQRPRRRRERVSGAGLRRMPLAEGPLAGAPIGRSGGGVTPGGGVGGPGGGRGEPSKWRGGSRGEAG